MTAEAVLLEGRHEPIIDKIIWEKVNEVVLPIIKRIKCVMKYIYDNLAKYRTKEESLKEGTSFFVPFKLII